MVILSLAHAKVDEATATNVYGAWSEIVVGDRPAGLVDCYLSTGDGLVQVAAVWESIEDHDRARDEELNHPAFGLFEACGVDPTHTILRVIGRFHQGK